MIVCTVVLVRRVLDFQALNLVIEYINTSNQNESEVAQFCLTLCNSMDYTDHGILQARIWEWVAFPFSRGSSQIRDRTQVSHIAGRFFTI